MTLSDLTVGYALCGSFCTFSKVLPQMRVLLEKGMHIVPIMSQAAYSIDTRFGKAADFRVEIEEMCGEKIIHTLFDAEPIGPKKLLDILIIEPCTGSLQPASRIRRLRWRRRRICATTALCLSAFQPTMHWERPRKILASYSIIRISI